MGVNQSHQGVRSRAGDHQPGAHDRQHRPARAPGPTRSPASATRWARGSSRTPRTCSAGTTSPTPSTAPRSPACSESGGADPDRASWAYDQILEGIRAGKIRGLWVIGTNPAHSWIDQADLRDILGRLDFLVVQDMYHSTETAQLADLVLPAAGWGEKEGTFINSERRIGLIKKVRRAPGQALADFHIFKLVAHYYGCGAMFTRWDVARGGLPDPQAELTRGQPCDITGIADYDDARPMRGIQWPLPRGSATAGRERRLFADGRFFHADGRARFVFGNPRAVPEPPDDELPLQLLTGRGSSRQWHTQTRTAKSDVLRKLCPAGALRRDQPGRRRALGIAPDERVVVESRRGRRSRRAFVTHGVQRGQVFVPMHDARANQLTLAAFDPYSRQPAYKACAVSVRLLLDGERDGGDD